MKQLLYTFIIIHLSLITLSAQRTKDIYIQVIDTAGLAQSIVADTSWILGQLDVVRAEIADTSEHIQGIIDQQRRLYFAPYYLGQDTLGGIIYHLELDSEGAVHGLIACPEVSDTIRWTVGSDVDTTKAYSYSDGQANVAKILAFPYNTHPAAYYCDTLTYAGFTDWYMPSLWEMKQIFQNYRFIDQSDIHVDWFDIYEFGVGITFWTSTARNSGNEDSSWRIDFLDGETTAIAKVLNPSLIYVIPIRKF